MEDRSVAVQSLCAVVGLTGETFLAALRAALRGSGPALLPVSGQLAAPARASLLAALRPTSVRTSDGERPYPGGLPVNAATALVIATSGSTGSPKGVELTAASLTASARLSLARIDSGDEDEGARQAPWLCALPVDHVSGIQVLVRGLVGGTRPVFLDRFSPEAALAAAEAGCARTSLVPTQLRCLTALGRDLSAFRTILLGGSRAPAGLAEEARRLGARVICTYGMTETAGGCVYDGIPLDGVRVATEAESGRIVLAGPTLFSGYRLDPGRTREALVPDGYRTGDTGVLDPDGSLTVHGRLDDIVISGGKNIAPGPVATLLESHPAVREAAVTGRPDPHWGQCLVAAVVPADPAAPPSEDELRAWVRERLAPWAAPRRITLLPGLPRLHGGKTDMPALTALLDREHALLGRTP
ncbi:AMP-binding protein [Streptomyces sp. AP-93]|uniref:AMP-binding protein n=1 Tax=Streptomyces sp. AP-93 TaxID=2929048 RepID=UPI001FAEC173|nr:AMP-binding protein [Streptomyces sp. AP-93]MCJ0874995.1 AMP-binding protein [Streptomyces sp. AP-93]